MEWEYIKCAYCGYINDRNTVAVDDFKNGFFYVRCGKCNGSYAWSPNVVVFKYVKSDILQNEKMYGKNYKEIKKV